MNAAGLAADSPTSPVTLGRLGSSLLNCKVALYHISVPTFPAFKPEAEPELGVSSLNLNWSTPLESAIIPVWAHRGYAS
ncbi:hypothetical protein QQP08_009820 [Theobroma cacao]|nr:hypothetical protein QQP08_009820 [Theobroma cacao]